MPDWTSIFNTALGAGRSIVEMQYSKKAIRDAEQMARRNQRAMAAMESPMGAGGWVPAGGVSFAPTQLPAMGMGYASAPLAAAAIGGLMGFMDTPTGQSILGYGMDYLQGQTQGAGCFRTAPVNQRVSPCSEIQATGPDGKVYTWVYRGRPVLYAGDLATCRRVARVLKRSSRKAGARFR